MRGQTPAFWKMTSANIEKIMKRTIQQEEL